jgi:hypothetical protein
MNDRRTLIRVPALAAAIVVALLLLAGTYSVLASPAPSAVSDLPGDSTSADTWSSGWVPINQGQTRTFNHALGGDPDDYAVEVWFKDLFIGPQALGINRRGYGSLELGGNWAGAYWEKLTSNTIDVHRNANDLAADEVLVRVWVVPPASPPTGYDSGWRNIAAGATVTFTHGLNTTATDLMMGLWFSGTARGIHHHGFGGLTVDPDPPTHTGILIGAHWHDLTDNMVQITRLPGDIDVEQVRVIVVHSDPPDYDSLVAEGDWKPIGVGSEYTFTHNLNWPPSMMLVRGECYDHVGDNINLVWAGGNIKTWPPMAGFKGADVQHLTANTVRIHRWPDDDICPRARVRIWKRPIPMLYLPLVQRESS